jgi:hypothetical protein
MNHLRALRTVGVRLAITSQFPRVAQGSRFFRCVGCETRGRQHSMTIMAWVSRAVQEAAALAIPVTASGFGWGSLIAHMPNSSGKCSATFL